MKTLSATETRDNLESVIVEVMNGETFLITDDETGEPIARFEPAGSPSQKPRHRRIGGKYSKTHNE